MAVLPLIALGSPRPGAYSAATFPTGATPTRNAADAFASWLTPFVPDTPTNLLPYDDATIEGSVGTWVVNGNTTSVARGSSGPREGTYCLDVLAAGTGNSGIRTANGTSAIPVVAGQRYTFLVSAQANKATAGLFMEVAFWDSGGAGLGSQNNAGGATIKNTGYSDHALEVVAPAGAAYAGLLLQHGDSPTATDWRIDRAGLFAGSVRSIRWTAPAGGGGNSQALTAATETDAGVALPHETTRDLAPAAETDSARPLAPSRTRPVAAATETGQALALALVRARALAVAAETDAALALTGGRTHLLAPVVEDDLAAAVAQVRLRILGPAGEADSAVALTVPTKPGTITPRPVASPAITPAVVGAPAITPRTVTGVTLTTVDVTGASITPRPAAGATIRPT